MNEVTTAVGSVFLGLTVGCARCHDHKYDPIPSADFYRLQACFFPLKRDDVSAPLLDVELTAPVALRKQVVRIVTDSKRPEDPKNPDECNVFNIFKYFATPEAIESRHKAYSNGGLAYSEIKQELYELLNEFFGGRRDTYHQLREDKSHLDRILTQGAEKAREIAGPVLENVRRAIGISR